jgi:hypothetical protein
MTKVDQKAALRPDAPDQAPVYAASSTSTSRLNRYLLLVLAVYAALLWFFRPVTPFEWDEVLAQRAVLHYDVARHAPQPPGFPAFIGPAKAVNWVVHDPLIALQIVVILGALLAVAATWALARRLGASPAMAAAAAALVALSPEFLFTATVGISDVPGTAAGVGAVLALVAAAARPGLLPLAGAVCGVAVGVRPQIAAVFAPAGVWAVVNAVRARRWRGLALGGVTLVATAAACWIPAILVTGPRRWWLATRGHWRYVTTVEQTYHLPAAHLSDIATYWLLNSFADWRFAVPFWILVAVGIAVLVRTGRGKLAALAGGSAALYLASALFAMNETVSLRYMLPAAPFLAMLAAGGLASANRPFRRAIGALVAFWCLTAGAWTYPALRERLKPEPVWAALTWVRQHCDPKLTRVIYHGVMSPHVQYVLNRHGFQTLELRHARIFNSQGPPGEQIIVVSPEPVPAAELLFEAHHSTRRVVQLAWGRYASCAVSRMRTSSQVVFSPAWQLHEGGWQLWGTGSIWLPVGSKPTLVKLCASWDPLTLKHSGAAGETLAPNQCTALLLRAGARDVLTVSPPVNTAPVIPPVQVLPLPTLETKRGLASAYMVPQLAHVPGQGGAFWRSDLVVINPQTHPLRVAAQFLPTGEDNATASLIAATLAPDQVLYVPDFLASSAEADEGKLGAMLVYADPAQPCSGGGCNILVLARTYNSNAPPDNWRSVEWLPGVPASDAVRGGETATFSGVSNRSGVRTSLGVASWTSDRVHLRLKVMTADGRVLESKDAELPRFGHLQLPLEPAVTKGRVEVEVLGPGPQAMVVPYLAIVDNGSGLPAYLLPDALPNHPVPAGWRFPRPGAGAGE